MATRAGRFAVAASAALAILLAQCGAALAQQPGLPGARLLAVFPAGGQQGTTVEVTVSGQDLDDAVRLLFSDPNLVAEAKMGEPGYGQSGPQRVEGVFRVTVKPEARPGIHELRVAGKYGVSNPRAFMVSTQAEVLEVEPNNALQQATPVSLGAVVNGRSGDGADLDYFKFAARKGQRVVIDCWGFRIDSRMDPTLTLLDAAGRQLARSRDVNGRDPLLDFTAPADGDYFLLVNDFIYSGGNEHVYRLSLGTGPYVDFIFPPCGLPGSSGSYTLYGRNLPGSQPAPEVRVEGQPLEKLALTIALPGDQAAQQRALAGMVDPTAAAADAFAYAHSTPQGTAPPVPLFFTSSPLVVDAEPNNRPTQAQKVAVPCTFVGQFYPRDDRDWIEFPARQGEELWLELRSNQFGWPTDPALVVQRVATDAAGKETVTDLHAVDDPPGRQRGAAMDTSPDDPELRFVAPADGTYRVLVHDLYVGSRADPRYTYALEIRRPQPDFRLVAVPRFPRTEADPNQVQPILWSPLLRKGGADQIEVVALRRQGFDGEIQVSATGLPAGVTAAPVTIAPGQRAATLVLTVAEGAGEASAMVQVVGKARIGDAEVTRTARLATMSWGGQQGQIAPRYRLARDLAVAVSGSELAPLALDVAPGTVVEVSRAGQIKIPLKVLRRGEFKGAVQVAAVGLPPNVQPQNLAVDPSKAEAELVINTRRETPVGTYTVHLHGTSQHNYARNPEAAAAATARKAAVDKQAAELAAASKAAADAKAAAEKKLAEANAAAQSAEQQRIAAAQAQAAADAAAKQAADQAKAAQEAADKAPTDQNLAGAKAAAQKAADEMAGKARQAADAKTAAEKTAGEMAASAKSAADAKTAADKTFAAADAAAKAIAAFQQQFNQQVAELANRAKPQPHNIGCPSPPLTIKITAAPIAVSLAAPTVTVKQGAKAELGVACTRLYGFGDPIPLRVKLPDGLGGLNIPAVTIPSGQNEAKLAIEAGSGAPVGTHKLLVQALPQLNGQELLVEQPLTLSIEKGEAAK